MASGQKSQSHVKAFVLREPQGGFAFSAWL